MAAALIDPGFSTTDDKLSYEIFSILEYKFLFSPPPPLPAAGGGGGKVRILSIDGGDDPVIAAAALSRLEAHLQMQSGDPSAHLSDFFDVAAGSGAGGLLAAMLFTKPLFYADDALTHLSRRPGKLSSPSKKPLFRRSAAGASARLRRLFGGATLRDAVKPLLVPCYDLTTGAPFLFSRADAVEADGYDFTVADVCAATCAVEAAVEMKSVDGRTKILAVGGGIAGMGNPTAAAITHVLNNKQEFPFANCVEDLLVVSIGGGGSCGGRGNAPPSAAELVGIAGEGVADMVDQAVAMSFGHNRTSNYVRIQANGFGWGSSRSGKAGAAAEVMAQRNVESMLFRGKKLSEQSNGEKLEWFSAALVKENAGRKKSPIPTVIIKQAMTPRTSSATTLTSTTTTTTSSSSRISSSPR